MKDEISQNRLYRFNLNVSETGILTPLLPKIKLVYVYFHILIGNYGTEDFNEDCF